MKRVVSKNILLHYPKEHTEKPIISNLIKRYDLTVNISRARIGQDEEGTMVIEISGKKDDLDAGLGYLRDIGLSYKPISMIVQRVDEKCTHCSACTVVCPSGALVIENKASMEVLFKQDECTGCGLCIPACPYNAMVMSE
jgi:Fe-S-cluster-containing dehydrogenase component